MSQRSTLWKQLVNLKDFVFHRGGPHSTSILFSHVFSPDLTRLWSTSQWQPSAQDGGRWFTSLCAWNANSLMMHSSAQRHTEVGHKGKHVNSVVKPGRMSNQTRTWSIYILAYSGIKSETLQRDYISYMSTARTHEITWKAKEKRVGRLVFSYHLKTWSDKLDHRTDGSSTTHQISSLRNA